MTKNEKIEYLKKDSIAYYSGFCFCGLELKEIDYGIEDYMIVVSGAWCSKKDVHRLKVYYGSKNDYIKLHGYRIPLNEFIIM